MYLVLLRRPPVLPHSSLKSIVPGGRHALQRELLLPDGDFFGLCHIFSISPFRQAFGPFWPCLAGHYLYSRDGTKMVTVSEPISFARVRSGGRVIPAAVTGHIHVAVVVGVGQQDGDLLAAERQVAQGRQSWTRCRKALPSWCRCRWHFRCKSHRPEHRRRLLPYPRCGRQ